MPIITKKYKFSAAHRYWNVNWDQHRNYSTFGEDINLHGHNYELEISIKGPIDTQTGFLINLKDLKNIVSENVLNLLDHHHIEKDIDWFTGKQPTTENIVVFIWEQLQDKIKPPAVLYKIKLIETPTIFCEYYGEERKQI